ncbi:MAG: acetolactate synthase large subunit [Alphaproteobacteria bacterium]|nr:acetolactate synthase large subunit [Alphaproteobacteria bacterium]
MNGADCVVKTLMAGGIDVCFANPGTSEMALVAALDRSPGMKCVLGLFEGVVTGAADGYARMTRKPAATLLHCGPGLANGLANLHNAKRARSPLVSIVGSQATYHQAFMPPLQSDVEATARPYSDWVRTSLTTQDVGLDTALAIKTASHNGGQVASLIVPANVAWQEGASLRSLPPQVALRAAPQKAIEDTVAILKSGEPTALMLAGDAALEAGLRPAGRIARASGASLRAMMFNPRISRGGGLPALVPVPYNVDQALASLAGIKHLILVGADAPVAFFAYPGKPSSLVPADCEISVLASPGEDAVAALEAIASEFPKTADAAPGQASSKPTLASGDLTPDAISQSLGALIPEGAIVTDEALTSGRNLYAMTAAAAPHDWLQLTGGSIGIGIPLATGAAVACPDRRTICLQADGSAMYTLQGLWTQARERLNVTTVIYANSAYAILKQELASMGVSNPGRNATDMMDLGRPDLDWVSLATGMGVEAKRVTTAEQFNDAFKASLGVKGPFLIEAAIGNR